MQNHKEKIKEILIEENPIDTLNNYIVDEVKNNDKYWLLILVISFLLFVGFYLENRKTEKDVIEAAKPLVEKIKIKYQATLDSIVKANDFVINK